MTADNRRELDELKKAVEMCIAAGFLKQEKLDEALEFVRGRKPAGEPELERLRRLPGGP